MTRNRRPRGEWFWEAMVAACGKHCCAPGCPKKGPLHQGHIERHAEGFGDDPENLIPLCKACNNKYKKVRTPDGRPDGWRERFILILGYVLQPKFLWLPQNSYGYLKPATEVTQSTELIVWPEQPVAGLFTTNTTTRTAYQLVEQILDESQEKSPRANLPKSSRKDAMVKLAEGDTEMFLPTCREFLRRKLYLREEGGSVARDDSWAPLCDNYKTIRRWAEETLKDKAVADAKYRANLEEHERKVAAYIEKCKKQLLEDVENEINRGELPGFEDKAANTVAALKTLLPLIGLATEHAHLDDIRAMLHDARSNLDRFAAEQLFRQP